MSGMKAAQIEISGGGVVYRRGPDAALDVLLIKDSYGNWGFPKGHVEAGESLQETAMRESEEETGLRSLRAVEPLATTDWYFRAGKTLIHKYCDYFLLEADAGDPAEPQRAEGIQACSWLSPEEAVGRVTYANARQVLKLALERLRPRAGSEADGSAPATGSATGG
jgi:diadenosine hexaphosphate hydrolase (ATP-forming)